MRRLYLAAVLLTIFLISAGLNYGLLQHAAPYTPEDTARSLEAEIAATHGVFLAILIGGIFSRKQDNENVPRLLTVVSIVLAIAWGAFIASSWSGYPLVINASVLLAHMNARGREASFLVAGMLAYLCGSEPKLNND